MSSFALNAHVLLVFTYPLDLLRARLASEVRTRRYRNVLHGMQQMYRHEGLSSLFRGMQPTLFVSEHHGCHSESFSCVTDRQGIVPYAGVNFGTYETLKFYSAKNENGEVRDESVSCVILFSTDFRSLQLPSFC